MLSGGANGSGQPVTTPGVGEDEIRRRSEVSQRRMTAFGSIVTILSQSPVFQKHALADLQWLVAPAVVAGQYSIAQARTKSSGEVVPVGV